MRNRSLVAVATVAILGVSLLAGRPDAPVFGPRSASAQGAGRLQAVPVAPQYVPGELLIKFKDGATEAQRSAAYRAVGVSARDHIYTDAMRETGGPGVVHAAIALDVPQAIAALKNNPAVEYAEPNWIYQHAAVSNDTHFVNGNLWGMYGDSSSPANQYGSQAAEAWAAGHTGSSDVYVGIIDEGVQFDHPDLVGQVWTNPFDPTDGVDNDGNGYVDDTNGWDFANNDRTVYDGGKSGGQDDHGTHVAGTIGAKGGNGLGVVGVNWNVTMISGKFLGRSGGTTAAAIKAVDYFTDLKTRHGINIVATNNSWGGGGFSQALLDAIVRGAKANILFIAAAGNGGRDGVGDNNDSVASYPSNYNTTSGAGYDAVIAVASITSSGGRSSFSNYGATTVDIGAPGSSIVSTTAFNTLSSMSGTSMATPHVTGAAALWASTHPTATALDIRNAILNSATPTPSLSGRTVTGGRLNVSGF